MMTAKQLKICLFITSFIVVAGTILILADLTDLIAIPGYFDVVIYVLLAFISILLVLIKKKSKA
ncbi:hypothetical protein H7U19_02510 [Hyunsoonleella sp. SJ7]|uniref:Uncharacterized protein n=1 Tax=Hyunsoonleella aquatilis TaxID=2762758 RepID=A0A923HA25_9FLAO|nr:hypothetical protein [Hyunsoonleella aquatilis]MBC3757259.1 hypothetical protein [Hyunsoonleella aquatilis]